MTRTRIVLDLPSPVGAEEGPASASLGIHVSGQVRTATLLPSLTSTALWALSGIGFVLCFLLGAGGQMSGPVSGGEVWIGGLLLSSGLGLLLHALWARPLLHVGRSLRAESQRLRSSLTCPYCRDGHDDRALVCDRDGCGAFYHQECWDECRANYGGCAVFGCGCTSAHEVGRFALRKRAWRLLVAAVLFPPKAAKRIRELESQSFKEIWAEAWRHQDEVSRDPGRTLLVGLLSLVLSMGAVLPLGVWAAYSPDSYLSEPWQLLIFGVCTLFTLVLPPLFMRFPLARAFLQGSAKLIGGAFRDELAALGRADEGTFLSRLAAGVGKKG